jgi:hypothetical protein
MGYTHDNAMTVFVPPTQCMICDDQDDGGFASWWADIGEDGIFATHRPADGSESGQVFSIAVPVALPANQAFRLGSRLVQLEVFYIIDGHDLAACDLYFFFNDLDYYAQGFWPPEDMEVNIPCDIDADHDTSEKRSASGIHKLTLAISHETWMKPGMALYILLGMASDPASQFALVGARINYTERT